MSRAWIALALGPVLCLAACDKVMRVEVSVRDGSGEAVEGASVRISSVRDRHLPWSAKTSDDGTARESDTYGFGSEPRMLTISKTSYKAFSTRLPPRPRYACRIVLVVESSKEASTGLCEERIGAA
jgi:hypothetical protein